MSFSGHSKEKDRLRVCGHKANHCRTEEWGIVSPCGGWVGRRQVVIERLLTKRDLCPRKMDRMSWKEHSSRWRWNSSTSRDASGS